MKISRNLWIFCIINLMSSIVFFTYLGNSVSVVVESSDDSLTYSVSMLAPIVYAAVWFLSGLMLGYSDMARQSRSDLGLMYHQATLVVLSIGVVYGAIMFDKFRTWQFLVLPVLFTAITVIIHWLVARNRIKGISKTDAFK